MHNLNTTRLLERPRLTNELCRDVSVRARIVCAPAGSGKTVALNEYAVRRGTRVRYVQLPRGATLKVIEELVRRAGLAGEVILDGFDDAEPAATKAFVERLAGDEYPYRFILSGRSPRYMRVQELLACSNPGPSRDRGSAGLNLAAIVDPNLFAFDPLEVAKLTSAYHVEHTAEDATQVFFETSGWTLAVDNVIRCAVQDRRPLRGAFDIWLATEGRFFLTRLATRCPRLADDFETFQWQVRDGSATPPVLEHFYSLGFPVVKTQTSIRPHRLLANLLTAEPEAGDQDSQTNATSDFTPPLIFNLLGRFQCSIGGRPLQFKRRRDRHVLTYIALQPSGTVTRDELIEAFWPDMSPAVARQGLRTTLSHIRMAIASVAGADRVETYFSSPGPMQILVSNAAVDVLRFTEHVELARLEEMRNALALAKHHYEAAERLYQNPLLSTEPVESCFQEHIEEAEERYTRVLQRLVEIYTNEDDYVLANRCSLRLARRAARRGEAMA